MGSGQLANPPASPLTSGTPLRVALPIRRCLGLGLGPATPVRSYFGSSAVAGLGLAPHATVQALPLTPSSPSVNKRQTPALSRHARHNQCLPLLFLVVAVRKKACGSHPTRDARRTFFRNMRN